MEFQKGKSVRIFKGCYSISYWLLRPPLSFSDIVREQVDGGQTHNQAHNDTRRS